MDGDTNNLNGINNDTLDAIAAEFALQFPDFDVFNYIDPAMDVALDATAANVLDEPPLQSSVNALAKHSWQQCHGGEANDELVLVRQKQLSDSTVINPLSSANFLEQVPQESIPIQVKFEPYLQ